jgi:hypothetical protein
MAMWQTNFFRISLAGFLVFISLATPDHAAAHCDTLDGPVIQDARLAIAATDQALASGSPEALMHLIIEDVVVGIKERYEHAMATYKHKDESVARGREFVAAYIEFTHYVERLHQDATAQGAHGEASKHDPHNMGSDPSKH